jgi:hypothetical protein
MSSLYSDRLNAIRTMLKDQSSDVVEEGYDLLFRVWLENSDSPDFVKDLLPIAFEHNDLIQELNRRAKELILKDTITDIYLRTRLKNLALEILEQTKTASSISFKETSYTNDEKLTPTQTRKLAYSVRKFTRFGLLLFGLSGLLLGLSIWLAWSVGLIIGIITLTLSLLFLVATMFING